MKKFMKGCGMTALILILLGLLLAMVARSVRGKIAIEIAIEDVVESVTGGRVHMNLSDWDNWGITTGEEFLSDLGAEINEEINYSIKDSMIFDDDFEILKGDIEKYSVGKDILELDVEVGGCSFEIKTSEDANFYLEAEKTKKFQGYVDDQILYIKGTMNTSVIDDLGDCEITLYVPEGYRFDKVDMELGAGQMVLGDLSVGEAHLEVGAGQITTSSIQADDLEITVGMGELLAKDMQVKNLEAEVDMGHLYAEGDITQSAKLECAMGSIEMELTGAWEDFNYNLECGMGNLEVGDDTYSGLATEKQISNVASKQMDVECAMGNIEIDFVE